MFQPSANRHGQEGAVKSYMERLPAFQSREFEDEALLSGKILGLEKYQHDLEVCLRYMIS